MVDAMPRNGLSYPLPILAAMGYRGKVVERERARELRAESWTLVEIADELGVAKSSVSLWVRDVEFEPKPRAQVARRRGPNALQRRKQAEIDELLADGPAPHRPPHRPGVPGRRHGSLRRRGREDATAASASPTRDPRMIAFFCAWLRHFFDDRRARLRVQLYLHEGLDLEAAIAFWTELTSIPISQFSKPYRAVRRSVDPHGEARLRLPGDRRYSCTRTHRARDGPRPRAAILRPRHSGVAQLAERSAVKPNCRGFEPHPRSHLQHPSTSLRRSGPVAQWSEQATHNRWVGGSIPPGPTHTVDGQYWP